MFWGIEFPLLIDLILYFKLNIHLCLKVRTIENLCSDKRFPSSVLTLSFIPYLGFVNLCSSFLPLCGSVSICKLTSV